MFPLLFLACAAPDSDVETPADCGEGFGRADDGNCYPVDADTDTDTDTDTDADTDTDTGAAWEVVEVTCEGEASYWAEVAAGEAFVQIDVWGYLDSAWAAYCDFYETSQDSRCDAVDDTPVWIDWSANARLTEAGTMEVWCLHQNEYVDGDNGGPGLPAGFYPSPISVSFLAN